MDDMALRRVTAALVVAAMWAAPVAAQPVAAPTAGWSDGFVVQSGDGSFRLLVGLVLQADGRFAVDDPVPTTNTFLIRKLRPTLSGRIGRYIDFKVMPDFGSGNVEVPDAYIDVRFSPALRLRAGKDKTPVGYEMLQGDPYVLFPERSIANSLVPNRDIGFQAQGDLLGGRVFYAAGLFNGVPDGASSSDDRDTNNGKDAAGRIVVRPFRSAASDPGPLSGLGMQLGGSTGTQAGALPAFRSPAGQTYFSYGDDVEASGSRQRLSPAVFYYEGPIGAFVEYMRSSQVVRGAVEEQDVTNQAWNATVSFVVTGEAASERGVDPARPFDPQAGGVGAFQVLVRYAELSVDPEVFAAGLAAAGASRQAATVALGLNWYATRNLKAYVSVERTGFEDIAETTRPAEHVVLFRLQLAF